MNRDDSTTRLLKTVGATIATLLIGLVIAPVLSRWHHHLLVQRLSEQVSSAPDTEIKVPLRKLAGLGVPAIESLVRAAASERAAVAIIARQIIDEKLAAWESVAATGWLVSDDQQSITTLATSLRGRIHQFGHGGKRWAERTTLSMIEFSKQLSGRQTRVLLDECSEILAAIPPRDPKIRTVSNHNASNDQTKLSDANSPQPKLESLTRTSEGSLDVIARIQPRTSLDTRDHLTKVPEQRSATTKSSARITSPALEWSQNWVEKQPRPEVGTPKRRDKLPEMAKTSSTNSTKKQVVDVPTPQEMAARAIELERYSTEELLARFQLAPFHESGIIRLELRARGYPDVELAFQQRMASPQVTDRLQLVEDISQLPATSAKRVLRHLLLDKHADVRLRALTALATTNSPNLKELAHKLALHDDDPRVVELASRLLRQSR